MKVTKIFFKNFRSYGESLTEIDIPTDKGNLILLTGNNGSGKSSIRDSILWTLFAKVPPQSGGKVIKHSDLMNMTNKANGGKMQSGMEFKIGENSYSITRTKSSPSSSVSIDVLKNETEIDFKDKNEWITQEIGFTFELFKNFIFISISDFNNILKLSPKDKKALIDKLFNFDVLNEFREINKNLKKENTKNMAERNESIRSIQGSIQDILEDYKARKKESEYKSRLEGEKLSESLKMALKEVSDYKEKIAKLERSRKKGLDVREKVVSERAKLESRFNELVKKIKLFEEHNICPTCGTSLDGKEHKANINEVKKAARAIKKEYKEKSEHLTKVSAKLNQIESSIRKYNQSLNENGSQISVIKKQLSILEKKVEEADEESTKELIKKWKTKITVIENELGTLNSKSMAYTNLDEVFSEKGIRRRLIKNITDPLNDYFQKYLTELDFPYDLEVDDQFNVKAFYFGEEKDNIGNMFSSGEMNKTVICLLLAYLELIQLKNPINILFLDELFGNLDSSNVEMVLKTLRLFAARNNVNIFIVHHARLDESLFDKIIYVEKEINSKITIHDSETV